MTYVNPSIGSQFTLFAGGQKKNTVKKNEIDLKSAIQDKEKLKNDIALNVAAGFLQILLTQETLSNAKQQTESTKERIEKTKKTVDAGKLTLSSLLEIQAQLSTEEAQIVKAENDLDMAYLNLKQMLELYDAPDFKITSPEILTVPDPGENRTDNIFSDAVDRMPEVKSAQLQVESSKKSLDIASGGLYPTLGMFAYYSSAYSSAGKKVENTKTSDGRDTVVIVNAPFGYQMKENNNLRIGLSLSIPIFNGLQARTGVKNAQLGVKNSELNLQKVKNTLYKDIQQASADVQAQYKNYAASQKNVDLMTESFRYSETRLDVGAITSTDYIVAKNNLFKAKSDCVQAKYQYIFQLKILDFYKGLVIKL